MLYQETNQQNIIELSELIRKNAVIPFIGAGMSCPIYPTWKAFLEQLPYSKKVMQECRWNPDSELQNYEDFFQYYADRFPAEYVAGTQNIFALRKLTFDKINKATLFLPILFDGPMVTTNLDQTLEWIWMQCLNKKLAVGLADETGFIKERIAKSEPCLWKIHGDIDKSDEWVLTSKEYAHRYGKDSFKFMEILYSILNYKVLLFLGSSLQSDKIVSLLQNLFKKEKKHTCHFAILPAPNDEDAFYIEASRLSNLGIRSIWYPKNDYDTLEKIVGELAEKSGKNAQYLKSSGVHSTYNVSLHETSSLQDIEGQLAKRYDKEAKIELTLLKNAEHGDSTAQYLLGEIIIKNSREREEQYLRAVQWFRKAADQGNVHAQCSLGRLYEMGKGVKQDYEQAAYWYRTAEETALELAKQGEKDAQYTLGTMYEFERLGIKKNYKKAIKWYTRAASQGDINAQFRLGKIYETIEQDYTEAIKWYEKAGSQGADNAFLCLSKMYEKGIGVKANHVVAKNWYNKAKNLLLQASNQGDTAAQCQLARLYEKEGDIENTIYWYQKAAEHGDTHAMMSLKNMYWLGNGVKENRKIAIKWCQKAAEHENSVAMCALGNLYLKGYYVEQNYEMAINWYRKAILHGETLAIQYLGEMYEKGLGETSNYEKAFDLYTEYAYLGINLARRLLGIMYEKGKGIPQNDGEAVKWYQEAAEHGDACSQFYLARMYEEGKGVFKNIETAVYWYKRAAKNGNGKAQYALGKMHLNGVGVEINYKKAINYFEKASEKMEDNSATYLGFIYENGYGVEINYEKAISWYLKGAKLSNAYAQYRLGLMYEKGKGVPQNEQEAIKWYQKAVNNESAEALIALGKIYKKTGDSAKAEELYNRARAQGIDKELLGLE